MSRVADTASHSTLLNNLNRSIVRARDIQVQVSTGKVGLEYSSIGRDSKRLVSLEAERSRADHFIDSNRIVDLRLQKMESVVAQVTELATDARTFLVNAGHFENAQKLDVQGRMEGFLQTVAGLLNAEQNGRTLFAGGATDTLPVDLDQLPADGKFLDTADTLYYDGDSQILNHRASDTLSVDYGATAADPAFENLIRALKIAETVDPSDPEGTRQRLDRAMELVNSSLDGLPDVRGRIGSWRSILEQESTRMQDFTLALDQSVGDIENIDFAEAISRLGEEQAQLQASMAALSRLRQVSLTNFL